MHALATALHIHALAVSAREVICRNAAASCCQGFTVILAMCNPSAIPNPTSLIIDCVRGAVDETVLSTQWERLLAFIFLRVPGAANGAVFGPSELNSCPDYGQSGFRALHRELRGDGFVHKVDFQRYKLTEEGVKAARTLLRSLD